MPACDDSNSRTNTPHNRSKSRYPPFSNVVNMPEVATNWKRDGIRSTSWKSRPRRSAVLVLRDLELPLQKKLRVVCVDAGSLSFAFSRDRTVLARTDLPQPGGPTRYNAA